jgi:hypothetical protein
MKSHLLFLFCILLSGNSLFADLAVSASFLGGASVMTGIAIAILLWFGFNFTATSIEVIWMGRSMKLWIFECVSSLIVFVAMGAIIASL